jgi:hypothetical protein
MILHITRTGNLDSLLDVKETRLTKKAIDEIKVKYMEYLKTLEIFDGHLDSSIIRDIQNSEVRKLTAKEIEKSENNESAYNAIKL